MGGDDRDAAPVGTLSEAPRASRLLAWYFRLYALAAAPRLAAEDLDARRVHVHLVATLTTSLLMWAYAVLAWNTIASPIPGIVGFVASAIHLVSPLLFRFTPKVWLVAAVMMTPGLAHQCAFAYFTGGFASNILMWLPIHPVLGGLIAGRRAALGWSVLVSVITALGLGLELSGYAFPHAITETGSVWSQALLVFGWIFLALSLIWLHLYMSEDHEASLIRKNRNIQNLLRILTHDVAAPVSSIRFLLYGLSELPAEEQAERLRSVKSACDVVDDMIRSVQGAHGFGPQSLSGSPRPHVLGDSLRVAAGILKPQLEQKRQTLRYDAARLDALEGLVDPIVFDRHVLPNVLSNAIKFSPVGATIEVRGEALQGRVALRVRDAGPGIPAEVLASLRLGERAPARQGTEGERGHGFGLLIVQSLMEEMGGRVSFGGGKQAGEHAGSEVTLTLRAAETPPERQRRSASTLA